MPSPPRAAHRFPASTVHRPEPGPKSHSRKAEKCAKAATPSPGTLLVRRADQRLIRRVQSERPRRSRHLNQAVEGLIQLLARDRGQHLPDPLVELEFADPAVCVGLFEPRLSSVALFGGDMHVQAGVLVSRAHVIKHHHDQVPAPSGTPRADPELSVTEGRGRRLSL